MKEYKVVMLGAGNVGKSALTIKFSTGRFHESYDPTMEDFYRREITVARNPAILEILDTAGTQQFPTMLDLYIKNGQSFIIVFSLTSRNSFESIKNYKEDIFKIKLRNSSHSNNQSNLHKNLNIPIIIVGNKCDMQAERIVSFEEAQTLANSWSCQYFETSAKLGLNVQEIFLEAVKQSVSKCIESQPTDTGFYRYCVTHVKVPIDLTYFLHSITA